MIHIQILILIPDTVTNSTTDNDTNTDRETDTDTQSINQYLFPLHITVM